MNTLSKKQVFDLIADEPYRIGQWMGFKDLTELHNEWLKMFLFTPDDQTLQGHRGSYKTTTLSIFFAIHTLIKPNETILFFRKTGSDVVEVMRQTANMLQSGCFQRMAQVIYGSNIQLMRQSGTEISTNLSTTIKGSSQIVGLGIGTSITGKHADIVVTDDIVNVNDRSSKAERERTKRAYMELENIKNRGGRFINTGTPWHEEDAFSLMPNPVKYDCYTTGLMTEEQIEHVKDRMLPSLFAANYELRHIASEDIIFDNPITGADATLAEQGIAHIDAAYGGEDYTAFTICHKTEGKYYVFGKAWRKHVDDVMGEIIELRKKFNAGKIYCEINSDKGYLAKELRKRGERVSTYHENSNKFIKITSYLKGEWRSVIFVAGTDEDYIKLITDYNENAEHDDAPDSLASVVRILWSKKDTEYRPYLL